MGDFPGRITLHMLQIRSGLCIFCLACRLPKESGKDIDEKHPFTKRIKADWLTNSPEYGFSTISVNKCLLATTFYTSIRVTVFLFILFKRS